MKSIAISSALTGVIFLALGIGLLVWWHGITQYRPLLKPSSAKEVEFVRTTTDLEHLRAYTQLLIRNGDQTTQKTNEFIDVALNMIAGLAGFCGVLSFLGWANARKAYLIGSGSPLPKWLRWL